MPPRLKDPPRLYEESVDEERRKEAPADEPPRLKDAAAGAVPRLNDVCLLYEELRLKEGPRTAPAVWPAAGLAPRLDEVPAEVPPRLKDPPLGRELERYFENGLRFPGPLLY